MIRTISVFIATSLLVVMLCDTLVLAEDTEPYKTGVRTMLVDPFKDTEQWTLKFSKFRSRYFAPAIKQEAETDIAEKQSREPNKLWYMIVDGSKYPEILPPNALPAYRDEHPYILGIKARFDFPGQNWIILEPSYSRISSKPDIKIDQIKWKSQSKDPNQLDETVVADYFDPSDSRIWQSPYFIYMYRQTVYLSLWVWGCAKRYNLDAYFEDYNGIVHKVSMGSLNFRGWRKITVKIPTSIPQASKSTPLKRALKFLRFKISSELDEDPGAFYLYFAYMEALFNPLELPYHGQYLEVNNREIWSEGAKYENKTTQ